MLDREVPEPTFYDELPGDEKPAAGVGGDRPSLFSSQETFHGGVRCGRHDSDHDIATDSENTVAEILPLRSFLVVCRVVDPLVDDRCQATPLRARQLLTA